MFQRPPAALASSIHWRVKESTSEACASSCESRRACRSSSFAFSIAALSFSARASARSWGVKSNFSAFSASAAARVAAAADRRASSAAAAAVSRSWS